MEVVKIPLSKIVADHDWNCRGVIAPVDIWDLAKDMQKNGLLSPVMVMPYKEGLYRLVAGFCRFMAAKHIHWTEIDCIVHAHLNEFQARSLNLRENIVRRELNILQEARALKIYLIAGWTEQAIADELQQSQGWVHVRKGLLTLPEDIQKEAAAKMITQEHIRVLAGMSDNEKRYELVRQIKDKKLRGETARLQPKPRRINPHKLKHRNKAEIETMLDKVIEITGAGFHTRCMAWCSGNISTFDFLKDLEAYCQKEQIEFKAPEAWG